MKKLTILVAIIISLISCEKEEVKQCNCGTVINDNAMDYSVVIRNECSGNNKTFYLEPGDWMNAHLGSEQCISNTTNW